MSKVKEGNGGEARERERGKNGEMAKWRMEGEITEGKGKENKRPSRAPGEGREEEEAEGGAWESELAEGGRRPAVPGSPHPSQLAFPSRDKWKLGTEEAGPSNQTAGDGPPQEKFSSRG